MTSAYMKAKGHREIWNDLKANKAYRVPAKCRDLLEMRTTFTSRPKIDSLTWKTNGKYKGSTGANESSEIPKPHAIEKVIVGKEHIITNLLEVPMDKSYCPESIPAP